jgi:Glycosyl transferase family 2
LFCIEAELLNKHDTIVGRVNTGLGDAESTEVDLHQRIALAGYRFVEHLSKSKEPGKWLKKAERRIAEVTGQRFVRDYPAMLSWRSFARRKPVLAPPAISVITPTFNRTPFLLDAVASIIGQSLARWELIIVDDGSTDDTEAAVAPFLKDPRIRYFRQEHAGCSAARNRGLREARAGLVTFLDSDNLYFPGFLAAAVAAFDKEPDISIAYGILATRHHSHDQTELLFNRFDRAALVVNNYIDANTIICRKLAVDRVGGFDESLERLEDWDLLLRLTADTPARALPVLAAYYRVVDKIRMTDVVPEQPALDRIAKKLASASTDSGTIAGTPNYSTAEKILGSL